MCGIIGNHGHPRALELIAIAMQSMQHRGQNACGVACRDVARRQIHIHKDMGLVAEVLDRPGYRELEGSSWIGHVRWPTFGSNTKLQVQPLYTQASRGRIAVAVNGEVVNPKTQFDFLESQDIRVYSGNDSELISAGIVWQLNQGKDLISSIGKMMKHTRGAYSVVLLADWENALFAFRDPNGFRPLMIGLLDNRYFVCSETCQLDKIGAQYIRDVQPGEIVRIDDTGLHSFQGAESQLFTPCTFEDLYFGRPDSEKYFSDAHGNDLRVSYYRLRVALGQATAMENPCVDADIIVPSPRSGIPAAIGYAQQMEKPYHEAILADGTRTFTQAIQAARKVQANEKYQVIRDMVRGRRVVFVDDSCIKLLTALTLVRRLYEAGASEVHARIASPKYLHPCCYGVETKEAWALGASDKSECELRRAVGNPTSIKFLSLAGFRKVIEQFTPSGCYACFDGNYPVT